MRLGPGGKTAAVPLSPLLAVRAAVPRVSAERASGMAGVSKPAFTRDVAIWTSARLVLTRLPGPEKWGKAGLQAFTDCLVKLWKS